MTDANTFPQPILITGGAGFLGSHMMALCLEKQTDVVVIDNLINSDLSNLQKLESHFKVSIPFYNIDIRDQNKLKEFLGDKKTSYDDRKRESILITRDLIKETNWTTHFESHKKKDDLADCFLQAKWYISNKLNN